MRNFTRFYFTRVLMNTNKIFFVIVSPKEIMMKNNDSYTQDMTNIAGNGTYIVNHAILFYFM